ncbi:phosphoenolpyruvate carboxykinase (ATP) [Chitinophaga dinghuensis]|uniref:Phosphoenolpyruvate carboxykinase (ATP) n=1 Tax=Chitinophaga dinghuensis TaxID=1539050 RepID=A0A327VKT1_9BACT|nr:phosphoenolpyruvate carboxykinase (ATP) [Chitinophaga dinghuensis]RAJ73897.1 phosphoenolpyruvate carboxykinase (ATP) [Chitinophaga dinghuensis]
MQMSSVRNPVADLRELGIENASNVYYQLEPAQLVKQTLERNQGVLSDTGALAVNTGEFTGRSPKDKFIVKDQITANTVNWNDFNIPFTTENFDRLYDKVTAYFAGKDVWVRDCFACADTSYRIGVKVITELPWSSLFAYNMFLRPSDEELEYMHTDWTVIQAPGFMADPAVDGTRQHNFAVVSFTRKIILIGGTAYTGEIKKGIFTILNYILPQDKQVLSMHCSANQGAEGDTAIFFGLSGTGKTTLSADPNRKLIGDDEHGWTNTGVFNFEGGCYAKCIDLSAEKEPEIFQAVRPGALLENITFFPGTNQPNYADKSITENTRVSYPLTFIPNALEPSVGAVPKNIFFLTADAYGVLPPISRLTPGQAMYQFISGYTAKVAGTEAGVTEPKSTFSACFGAPFLPLHPAKYAQMLGEKMRKNDVNVWLINTGWTGGPYGVGSRIKLAYTRAIIAAAIDGKLEHVRYRSTPVFGLAIPETVPGVPTDILDPRNTWADKAAYDAKAADLAGQFIRNFQKYAGAADQEILASAPKI